MLKFRDLRPGDGPGPLVVNLVLVLPVVCEASRMVFGVGVLCCDNTPFQALTCLLKNASFQYLCQ